ncbi:MAG: hypothetical protein ABSE27_04480 [Acidobacteriaceae bacterium]|jgi:hypothetical protein
MKKWSVTSAAADFDAFWDKVENEGPQILRRRRVDFVIGSRTDLEAQMGKAYKIAPENTHDFWDLDTKSHAL